MAYDVKVLFESATFLAECEEVGGFDFTPFTEVKLAAEEAAVLAQQSLDQIEQGYVAPDADAFMTQCDLNKPFEFNF